MINYIKYCKKYGNYTNAKGVRMKKVLSLLKAHRLTLIMSILFATVNTVMSLLLPLYTKNILSEGILKYDMDKVWYYGGIMLLFTLAGMATSFLNTYFSTKTSVGYAITLRNFIFGKVSSLSQSDIDRIGVASLVTRTTNDVRAVHDIVLSTLKSIIPVPIMLAGGIIMARRMNERLFNIALWVIPVILAFAGLVLGIMIPMYSKIQKLLDKLNQIMREKIGGIRVIRAFNRTEYEDRRFLDTNITLTGIALRVARIMAGLMPILSLVMYVLICTIVYISVTDVNTMNPSTQSQEILNAIPNMYAFITYFTMMLSAITSIVGIIAGMPKAVISGRRINEIIEAKSDIVQPENPVTPAEEDRGCIEFDNVSFKYKKHPEKKKKKRAAPKKTKEVKKENPPAGLTPEEEEKKKREAFGLKNISFKSRPGETTAIIGITGSGKSTLLNLIPRLYDVTEGSVKVAGVDVRELEAAEIEKRIAVIPQTAFLFSGTIADNIRYGKPEATDAEIWKALEIAQAKSFVSSLPEGLEAPVSQAGKNFSGGQKQRLAIARAIIKGAEIMLFDDSFSALDLATDARLRASLRDNVENTNIIIVAQRVGTVLNADRIIVLDEGEIVGIGTHAELLETCDVYREIVVTQLSEDALGEVRGNE